MSPTVEKVANSVLLRASERIISLLVAIVLSIVLFVGREKSQQLDDASDSLSSLEEKLPVIENRLSAVEKNVTDISDDLASSRRARQKDWDEIRERLTRVETQTGTLLDSARTISNKLDSISERLPRREGMLFPGGTVGARQ